MINTTIKTINATLTNVNNERTPSLKVCLTPTFTNSSTRRTHALLTKPYRNTIV